MSAVELDKRLGWDLELVRVTECEHQESHECAEDSKSGHPPDVPDQCKARDDSEEGSDEAGRSIFRHLNRLVNTRFRRLAFLGGCELLRDPVGVSPRDLGQDGK